ncbi:protochlorophyllide oxidoreductase [Imhoffiella purpurea]|uniref:Light-independent protochlorophyllide reductase subunit B-like C-terminal domain-containing protein n=1 Tax=Imhoffiella purpurea TaxID=1249627 RepID=W9VE60_9GAMM|nr:protochlorophyllide oxidoreductase [Imhoffiella purpurea]EXJ15286.1 hypothetical protein D779_1584 [Imhoffiella purpurea]
MSADRLAEPDVTTWNRHEALFLDRLKTSLDLEDFTEYAACREGREKRIWSRARIYQGEKLDRVMVSQYSLRRGRVGLVIFAYPRVEYDIPVFLLHVGGMPPERTLLTLDLAPSSPGMDLSPFCAVAETHRPALDLPDTPLEWLSAVTSPHILHCAFKPLDPDGFFAAFEAVVETWLHHYIERAERDLDPVSVQARRETLLELKKEVFRNDPAFPVYTRAFGKTMSDVLAEAAFGGDPGVSIAEEIEPPPPSGSWVNKKLGVGWSADAQERVHEAPVFIRPMIRRIIEKEAAKEGMAQVDVDLVLRCEKKYRGGDG